MNIEQINLQEQKRQVVENYALSLGYTKEDFKLSFSNCYNDINLLINAFLTQEECEELGV